MDDSLRKMLTDGAADMGVPLDDAALGRFSTYLALLQQWGRKINLTTRIETKDVIAYHFLDSLSGVPVLAGSHDSRVVDLGAGAGLPSFPLKFAIPSLRLVLVESIRKKVAFCHEVIRATACQGTEVIWGRAEEIAARPRYRQSFDWAVSRALGQSADVAALALPFLASGGRILLYKGEPDAAELRSIDSFCARHRALHEIRRVFVPQVCGARCLITISLPDVPEDREHL